MEKYIFLDFNGTVLDDIDLCLELLNDLLREQNKEEVTKERYFEIFGFPVIEYYKRAGLDLVNGDFNKMADYFVEQYTRRNVLECKIYPDFKDFVLEAKKRGYKLVLCSATNYDMLMGQLKSFGIDGYFDKILGLSDYHAKSKVDIALNYVKEQHIDKDNLYFVGDTDHDDEVAKECGGKSILVCRGHQSENVLKKCGSTIVYSLLEVLNYIK